MACVTKENFIKEEIQIVNYVMPNINVCILIEDVMLYCLVIRYQTRVYCAIDQNNVRRKTMLESGVYRESDFGTKIVGFDIFGGSQIHLSR